jgi:hypothetical protein
MLFKTFRQGFVVFFIWLGVLSASTVFALTEPPYPSRDSRAVRRMVEEIERTFKTQGGNLPALIPFFYSPIFVPSALDEWKAAQWRQARTLHPRALRAVTSYIESSTAEGQELLSIFGPPQEIAREFTSLKDLEDAFNQDPAYRHYLSHYKTAITGFLVFFDRHASQFLIEAQNCPLAVLTSLLTHLAVQPSDFGKGFAQVAPFREQILELALKRARRQEDVVPVIQAGIAIRYKQDKARRMKTWSHGSQLVSQFLVETVLPKLEAFSGVANELGRRTEAHKHLLFLIASWKSQIDGHRHLRAIHAPEANLPGRDAQIFEQSSQQINWALYRGYDPDVVLEALLEPYIAGGDVSALIALKIACLNAGPIAGLYTLVPLVDRALIAAKQQRDAPPSNQTENCPPKVANASVPLPTLRP